MSVKPILFNTDMVRAILDGRKTVTRRSIKPKYKEDEHGFCVCTNKTTGEKTIEKMDEDGGTMFHDGNTRYIKPPYQPGDYIYVRETFNYGYFDGTDMEGDNSCWFEELHKSDGEFLKAISKYIYRADFTEREEYEFGTEDEKGNRLKIRWKPSIHMSKEAARIWLKVTDVRVERLRDMKAGDALKEGVNFTKEEYAREVEEKGESKFILDKFGEMWDSTIKKKGLPLYGWDANPWCFVISFEKINKSEVLNAQ